MREVLREVTSPWRRGEWRDLQRGPTPVQAAGHGVALAGGALEVGRGTHDLGAGPARLRLGAPAVAELGAQSQELLRRGFWRHQPAGEHGEEQPRLQ